VDNQFWQQGDFVKSSFFLVFLVPRKSLGTHFTIALPPVFLQARQSLWSSVPSQSQGTS